MTLVRHRDNDLGPSPKLDQITKLPAVHADLVISRFDHLRISNGCHALFFALK